MNPPEICPTCGGAVPPNAACCPHCGSDEQTGWSEKAAADHLDLPDTEFDYDQFVREEFGQPDRVRPRGIGWFWWVMALLLALLALLALW